MKKVIDEEIVRIMRMECMNKHSLMCETSTHIEIASFLVLLYSLSTQLSCLYALKSLN